MFEVGIVKIALGIIWRILLLTLHVFAGVFLVLLITVVVVKVINRTEVRNGKTEKKTTTETPKDK